MLYFENGDFDGTVKNVLLKWPVKSIGGGGLKESKLEVNYDLQLSYFNCLSLDSCPLLKWEDKIMAETFYESFFLLHERFYPYFSTEWSV